MFTDRIVKTDSDGHAIDVDDLGVELDANGHVMAWVKRSATKCCPDRGLTDRCGHNTGEKTREGTVAQEAKHTA